eukprot:CAMPEP_0170545044 /NCGR_PEP_ID=MMETSP0211-20121228/3576_1 /TAXON_ID=311385 /ORGANISM="Pseudokeronopsis sp., Strain OXSARD2" /LENGTH=89 /DNA_ID=CAMNT_0010848843 /DNA_START=534 /DNA_END=803 /DNA_ORIENTATION=-
MAVYQGHQFPIEIRRHPMALEDLENLTESFLCELGGELLEFLGDLLGASAVAEHQLVEVPHEPECRPFVQKVKLFPLELVFGVGGLRDH